MSVVVSVILLILLQGIIHILDVYCFFHVRRSNYSVIRNTRNLCVASLTGVAIINQHSLECKHRNSNEVVPDRFSAEASSLA